MYTSKSFCSPPTFLRSTRSRGLQSTAVSMSGYSPGGLVKVKTHTVSWIPGFLVKLSFRHPNHLLFVRSLSWYHVGEQHKDLTISVS